MNFNDAAHTGRDVYNDVWIDCGYDSKFAECCGAVGAGDEEAMTFENKIEHYLSYWSALFIQYGQSLF